ncbi:hypothetical protein PGB90_001727 [Kerria lacca]
MEEVNELVKIFVQIFEKENTVTVNKREIEKNIVKDGDNFSSGILRLKIEYTDGMQNLYKNVFLKIPTISANYNFTSNLVIFDREIYMYEVVLPRMYELWNEITFSPKFYAATKLKSLILEDLSESGFKTQDKKIKLDLNHSKIALRSLAQFHALSLKYLQTYGTDEIKLGSPYDIPNQGETQNEMREFLISLYNKFLEVSSTTVSEKIYQTLNKTYKNCIIEQASSIIKPNEEGLNVIRHGDCWTNNILFLHDDEGNVLECKMIDFQLSCIGSPIIDLIYFFITSVQFDVYEKYEEEFFDIYLNSLNDTLLILRVDKTYTRNDLNNDIEKYKTFYIFVIGITLQFITSNETQILNIMNVTSQQYISLVQKWLNYLDRKNLL